MEINGVNARARARQLSRPAFAVWVYLALIAVAEVVTVLVRPIAGVVLHSILLAVLVTHAALLDDSDMRRLLLPLSLAPLTRILSITMPLTVLPQIYWYPIIYLPLVVGAIVVMRQVGLSRQDVGLAVRSPHWQILIASLGTLLGLIEYLILRPASIESQLTLWTVVFASSVFIVTTGFVEELVFRGVLQTVMKQRFGWTGLLYTSILFSVLHLGFLSVLDMAFVFAVAMLFAWLVNKTGSLLGVTLAHGLTNVGLYVILPHLLR